MTADSRTEDPWLNPNLSNFAGWFRNLFLEERKITNRIARSLRPVLDGFQEFTLPSESLRSRTLRVRFKEGTLPADAPLGFALDDLSEGQRVLIALYSLMHYVAGTGRTLCIDEPDNYVALPEIQPWLDALRDTAMEHNGQVFLISHHPRVIDLLAPGRGFWFDRVGTGPVRVKRISEKKVTVGGISISQLIERGWLHG
jgi:predicted ATPase